VQATWWSRPIPRPDSHLSLGQSLPKSKLNRGFSALETSWLRYTNLLLRLRLLRLEGLGSTVISPVVSGRVRPPALWCIWAQNYAFIFRPLLSKAVNRLPRIYYSKLKFFPFLGFCLPPYFIHDASCIMLNIDWTPLQEKRAPWQKFEITPQQRTGLNLDGLNKNLSKLSTGMLRQGILNSHNDFV